jgi:hypothetical protein
MPEGFVFRDAAADAPRSQLAMPGDEDDDRSAFLLDSTIERPIESVRPSPSCRVSESAERWFAWAAGDALPVWRTASSIVPSSRRDTSRHGNRTFAAS